MIVYGIKNCDTVKKARGWLDEHGLSYSFHDYKLSGVDARMLADWSSSVGWEKLLNRSGTTFRKLPDAEKVDLDEAKALRLMETQPSMIKRPVVEAGGELLVGFDPDVWSGKLS